MNPSLPDSMHDDINKMKGDAIGDTMYSERWVLKTLMKLSQEYLKPGDYHLESSLEENLSLLWDMTIEPDVASFMMDNNAVELITDVITSSCSRRMNEIMTGILGNLACQRHIRRKIGANKDLIKVILNLLTSSDSPTLIQVVRLINTCIWNLNDKHLGKSDENSMVKEEGESCWISTLKVEKELLLQSLCFILTSSRNDELLRSTLGLIDSLFNLTDSDSDDYFCKIFSTENFVQALVEAIKEMTSRFADGNNSILCNEKLKHGLAHWISLLHRLASHNIGVSALEKQSEEVFAIVNSIWVEQSLKCDYFGRSHVRDLMLALEVMTTLLPFQSSCYNLHNALALLDLAMRKDYAEEEDRREDFMEALEEFCFLVTKQWKLKSQCLITDFKCYSLEEIDILSKVLEQKLSESSTSSSECVDFKLKKLESLIDCISL